MKQIVLIDRDGKEAGRLPVTDYCPPYSAAWIYHDGKWWGFGVGKLNGEIHFYESASDLSSTESAKRF